MLIHMLDRIDILNIQQENVADVIELTANEANIKFDPEIIDVLIRNYDEIITYVWDNSIDTITRYENVKTDYARYLKEMSPAEREGIAGFNLLPANKQ